MESCEPYFMAVIFSLSSSYHSFGASELSCISKNQHQFYIGIDLHARTMYICVINIIGETVFHKNMECSRDNLELVTNTFGKDIVVGVECIFTWYWVADFCVEQGIDFALGHTYYMKSIHGGKTKSDKIDSEKIRFRGKMINIKRKL